MLNSEEKTYYHRHLILNGFREEAQIRLKKASVLVIGAGGLGCPLLQYITAAGVGHITIIDDDVISINNLHRQVLYNVNDVGSLKATVAKEKLSQQNPNIIIHAIVDSFNTGNAIDLVGKHDLVIDGSDNFVTRYIVNDACVINKKPFVSGAIYTFSGQVSVFNHNGGATYRCLYPEPPLPYEMTSCSETGVLGVLPAIIGSLMANEAIKLITGIGETLSGRLLTYDALTNSFNTFNISLQPDNLNIKKIIPLSHIECKNTDEITHEQFNHLLKTDKENIEIIDVREISEFMEKNIGGKNISLSTLPNNLNIIDMNKTIVVVCSKGIRSRIGVKLIKEVCTNSVYSLVGGIK